MADESRLRPLWDARQEFTKALVDILKQIKDVLDQHNSWYRLLRTYNSLVLPYLTDKAKKDLQDKSKAIYNLLLNNNKKIDNYKVRLEELLYSYQDKLISSSNHLLMDADADNEDTETEDWLG